MPPVQAAIYCRVSLATMGDTTKVDDQEQKCREVCRARGWDVAAVFTDNSKSAWQRTRKRPGWDKMLAGVGEGRFGAVASYWGDRIVRQPRDLEDLLDLRDGRDLLYASVVGTYDLNNPDHRMMMRWEVARACNESDTISRRKKAQYDTYRREGRVRPGGPGGRSFGYESDNLTPRAGELDEVAAGAARILAGETPYSVTREWNARGLRTTAGNLWRTEGLTAMLLLSRYAGLMPDGESAAAWPAALDRETWERLRLALASRPVRNPAPTNARRWLLSGIATCGPCGAPLQISVSAGGRDARSYTCAHSGCGKIRRSAAHLDFYVAGQAVKRLRNELNPDVQPVRADHAAEWGALERERAEAEALVSDFSASAGRARLLMARLDQIDARMAGLRELAEGGSRARLIEQYRDITREQWDALALDVRRALVAACVTVTVLPTTRRGPGFNTDDVSVQPVA